MAVERAYQHRRMHSNIGYGLVGVSRKTVTSINYETWMKNEILNLLGLTHSFL